MEGKSLNEQRGPHATTRYSLACTLFLPALPLDDDGKGQPEIMVLISARAKMLNKLSDVIFNTTFNKNRLTLTCRHQNRKVYKMLMKIKVRLNYNQQNDAMNNRSLLSSSQNVVYNFAII